MTSGVPCPRCAGDTSVRDSRPREDGSIRRRRLCACGHRFTTAEVAIADIGTALHHQGVLQPHIFRMAYTTAGLLGLMSEQDRAVIYGLAHRLAGKDLPDRTADLLEPGRVELAAAE